VLAFVAAGCGGGGKSAGTTTAAKPLSKDAYGKALVSAARAANVEGRSAMTEIGSGKPGAVEDLKQSMRHFHDRLAAITPPAAAEKEHERLVLASGRLADQFGAAVDKQEPKTVAALRPLTNMTRYPAGKQVLQITAELSAKGYDLG
jgi:hypothetical protein